MATQTHTVDVQALAAKLEALEAENRSLRSTLATGGKTFSVGAYVWDTKNGKVAMLSFAGPFKPQRLSAAFVAQILDHVDEVRAAVKTAEDGVKTSSN